MLENLEFLVSEVDGMAVDRDFVTIEVHPKIPRTILKTRLNTGSSVLPDTPTSMCFLNGVSCSFARNNDGPSM